MTLKHLKLYFIAQEESHFFLEELYVTCAQTGSYNDPNKLWRTRPSRTIHPWRPKIPCHQWTWVPSKKKEPTHYFIKLYRRWLLFLFIVDFLIKNFLKFLKIGAMKKDQIVMVRRKQYHNTIRTKFDYKLANIITTNLNK